MVHGWSLSFVQLFLMKTGGFLLGFRNKLKNGIKKIVGRIYSMFLPSVLLLVVKIKSIKDVD